MAEHDQQPPWGSKKKPQTPEEMVAQIIKKLQNYFSDSKKPSSGGDDGNRPQKPFNPFSGIGKILAVVLVVILFQGLMSSVYKITPGEVGVILRLGRYNKTTEPGLHLKIPYFDKLFKVDVENIRKEEFGFRQTTAGQRSSFARGEYENESLMLTADKNVINVAWIVQYRVNNPGDFLFMVKDVRQAVRDLSESVTRRIVGNMDFDYVLSNRDLLAASVKNELQAELNDIRSGVGVGTVQFQDINPPEQVKPAFNEVNEADQDMKRLVNQAEEQYNKVIPKARGQAKQIVEEAHGYAAQRVNNAEGETGRFLDILREYANAPDVTRKRMYLETMQVVIPTVRSVYVLDENQHAPIPLLNLSGDKGLDLPIPQK
jgi:membrane protease subunit HflK